MKQNSKLRFTIFAALLTSIAVVLKLFLGIPVDMFGGLVKDINLSPTVIMLAGMAMGPVYGGLVGGITDVLVYVVRPMGSYNPVFTITNILMGVIPALFFLKKQKCSWPRVSLAVGAAQLFCSFLCNTLALILMGFMPPQIAWFRALSTFLLLPLHIALSHTLLRVLQRYLPALYVSPPQHN